MESMEKTFSSMFNQCNIHEYSMIATDLATVRNTTLHYRSHQFLFVRFIFDIQVELPISQFPRGCRDRRKIIDHQVMPKLMNLRWKNLEETGDPCNQAAKQEEIFAEISASKRDELDFTHMKLDDES